MPTCAVTATPFTPPTSVHWRTCEMNGRFKRKRDQNSLNLDWRTQTLLANYCKRCHYGYVLGRKLTCAGYKFGSTIPLDHAIRRYSDRDISVSQSPREIETNQWTLSRDVQNPLASRSVHEVLDEDPPHHAFRGVFFNRAKCSEATCPM